MASFSIWHWIIVIAVVAGILFAVRAKIRMSKNNNGELVGISRWLLLVIIGLSATILLTVETIASGLSGENLTGLKIIFSREAGELSKMRIPVAASFISGSMVIVSAGLLLTGIFSRNKNIRIYALVHYLLLAVAGIVDYISYFSIFFMFPETENDPRMASGAFRGVLSSIIWIPYFFVSKRVINTFDLPKFQSGGPSQ